MKFFIPSAEIEVLAENREMAYDRFFEALRGYNLRSFMDKIEIISALSADEKAHGKYMRKHKKHKFNAKKTVFNGIKFDSKKEANYYAELLLRQKAGEIASIDRQPQFVLVPPYEHNGQKVRALKYIADFKVTYPDGTVEIIDVKGYKTKEYKLKKKMLLQQYPTMNFKEV